MTGRVKSGRRGATPNATAMIELWRRGMIPAPPFEVPDTYDDAYTPFDELLWTENVIEDMAVIIQAHARRMLTRGRFKAQIDAALRVQRAARRRARQPRKALGPLTGYRVPSFWHVAFIGAVACLVATAARESRAQIATGIRIAAAPAPTGSRDGLLTRGAIPKASRPPVNATHKARSFGNPAPMPSSYPYKASAPPTVGVVPEWMATKPAPKRPDTATRVSVHSRATLSTLAKKRVHAVARHVRGRAARAVAVATGLYDAFKRWLMAALARAMIFVLLPSVAAKPPRGR